MYSPPPTEPRLTPLSTASRSRKVSMRPHPPNRPVLSLSFLNCVVCAQYALKLLLGDFGLIGIYNVGMHVECYVQASVEWDLQMHMCIPIVGREPILFCCITCSPFSLADHALFNASPKMVRRIKNQLSSSKKTAERNSYSGGEALMAASLSRKQHNRSDTLPAYSNTPMAALLSPSHIPTPRNWGRTGSSGTLQTVRRPREGDSGYGGDLNPHTRYPGGRERDGEWGGVAGREHTGSIWAKGKEPQRGRGSGKRDSAGREREREDKRERKEGQSRSQLLSSHPPPPPIAHQTELLMSYQHPSPLHSTHSHRHNHTSAAHDLLHRSATLPPSPEHHGALSPRHNSGKKSSNTLPTPSSPGMRRKTSYNMAVSEFDRPPPSSSYGSYHQPRSGDQLPYSTPENIREREFSHSYAPQSSARSANQSTIGQSGTHSSRQSGSHSRAYQSYGPERGESAQRSRRNHESYL